MITSHAMPSAAELLPLLPELVMIGGAFALLMADLFIGVRHKVWTHFLSVLVLAVVLAMLAAGSGGQGEVFNGMFVRDTAADVMKIAIVAMSGLTLVYGWSYLRERNLYKGEVPVLVLFATSGMMMLVSAGSLVTVYLGLELLALCSYALVAVDRDNGKATEAAMKYIVLGSLASGLLLYGMSLVYGATGTLQLGAINAAMAQSDERVLLLTGVVFMVAGVAFKLGAAPFHMWLPDVYHGAPTSVTLFIGTAPKIAYFALALRLLAEGLQGAVAEWSQMLAALAVLTLVVGNVVAIVQSNLKRMLAYSTISNVGFIVLGFVAGTPEGYSAALYYTLVYVLMSLGTFGVILLASRKGFEADELDHYKGLHARDPMLAFVMMVLMFSTAGIPPFVGFWAKLRIIQELWATSHPWLILIAIVMSVVGAFYYLRVVKLMYFDPPGELPATERNTGARVALGLNAAAVVLLGLLPGPLLDLCARLLH